MRKIAVVLTSIAAEASPTSARAKRSCHTLSASMPIEPLKKINAQLKRSIRSTPKSRSNHVNNGPPIAIPAAGAAKVQSDAIDDAGVVPIAAIQSRYTGPNITPAKETCPTNIKSTPSIVPKRPL